MKAPNLVNYTTEISAERTIGEIQKMLAAHRASAVLTEYGPEGEVAAVSFRITGPYGQLSYRLPGNVDKVRSVLNKRRVEPRYRTQEQAARVAWRIIKDWLAAQLSIIQTEMVTLEQVFLPYMQDTTGRPLYDRILESRFSSYALPSPK